MRVCLAVLISVLLAGTVWASGHGRGHGGHGYRGTSHGSPSVRHVYPGTRTYGGPRMNYSGPAYGYRYYGGILPYTGYLARESDPVYVVTEGSYGNSGSYLDYSYSEPVREYNDKKFKDIEPPGGISKKMSKDGSIRFSNMD